MSSGASISDQVILRFEAVSSEPGASYDVGLIDASFTLGPGDLVLVLVDPALPATAIADLAQGIEEPAQGRVLFKGRSWTDMKPAEVASARARIGRVFESGGWLSNLDVDENITLPMRYHTDCADDAAMNDALAIARDLGMADLPRARPHMVQRHELRRAQWVRALLAAPDLLLLERPTRELPAGRGDVLVQRIARERARGAAVVWITSDEPEFARPELKPTLKFRMQDSRIQPA